MSDFDELKSALNSLATSAARELQAAQNEQELRAARAPFLSKNDALKQVLSWMPKLPPDQRKQFGIELNAFKGRVEALFEARLRTLAREVRAAELRARPFDLTLPGRLELERGHAHPILQVRDDLLAIFRDLGFVVAGGPEIELEENNFTKLAFPPDHPATDMQDSFWVVPQAASQHGGHPRPPGPEARVLLRTHTSNVQVREMSARQPPMAIVSAGQVYRRDEDVTHSPMFHQVEGFLVAERVSVAELKGVLAAFAERLYGPGTVVRFRPSYFPFVEPGMELDVDCRFCRRPDGTHAGCRVCKTTGWLEVLGCGMIHPDVFRHCGIDPEKFTGFAFGMGIDRVAMSRYGVPNIRLMFENDPRFLEQF